MYPTERHQKILDRLKNRKSISVLELAGELHTGEATIRRDLAKLANAGLLARTHGGAMPVNALVSEIPLQVREADQKTAKTDIATLAIQTIFDNETLILDSSSTVLRLVPLLKTKTNLTIFSNGVRTCLMLADISKIRVYGTGGRLRENSLSFVGYGALAAIDTIIADQCFISCKSLSIDHGLTDLDVDEAELRKKMMAKSKKVTLLVDHTKFNQTTSFHIADWDKIDRLITDEKPNDEWLTFLEKMKVDVLWPAISDF